MPNVEQQATPNVHELRVAVFDLSKDSLVSPDPTKPALFRNYRPLRDDGTHGTPLEQRAVTIDHQVVAGNEVFSQKLLPRTKTLGRLASNLSEVSGYAVATSASVDFRNFSAFLWRFDIDDVHDYIESVLDGAPNTREMDMDDARLLMSGFSKIRELQRYVPHLQR